MLVEGLSCGVVTGLKELYGEDGAARVASVEEGGVLPTRAIARTQEWRPLSGAAVDVAAKSRV